MSWGLSFAFVLSEFFSEDMKMPPENDAFRFTVTLFRYIICNV